MSNAIVAAGAAVTGARHLRMARNGQDAVATWVGDGAAAAVVCDGCGSAASSEVGARLGAQLVIAALAARLAEGARADAVWSGVRDEVIATAGAAGRGDARRSRGRDPRSPAVHGGRGRGRSRRRVRVGGSRSRRCASQGTQIAQLGGFSNYTD